MRLRESLQKAGFLTRSEVGDVDARRDGAADEGKAGTGTGFRAEPDAGGNDMLTYCPASMSCPGTTSLAVPSGKTIAVEVPY